MIMCDVNTIDAWNMNFGVPGKDHEAWLCNDVFATINTSLVAFLPQSRVWRVVWFLKNDPEWV